MQRSYLLNTTLLFIFLFAFAFLIPRAASGQCSVTATSNPTEIQCGDTVDLSVEGTSGDTAFGDGFDDGGLDAGWSATSSADFSNPCDASVDGGTYLWMGDAAAHPRTATTSGFNVNCGGEVCFYLDFATQGDASPCEGIDLADEGVYFQYSTDGGTTWNTIEYFGPDGVGDSTDNAGSDPQMTSWNQYCFTIPPAAETKNTQFRWTQTGSSGTNNDHWGIDNVVIYGNDCDYYYDWAQFAGDSNQADTSVYVSSDTTFNVMYTNGVDDTCYANISINALTDVTATTDQYRICRGDSTTLRASASGKSETLLDDFDGGLDGSVWSSTAGATANTDCGSISGDALHFDDNDPRYAETVDFNTTKCSKVSFCLVFGGGGDPCEDADGGEDVEFQYSTDGGGTWNTINTYTTGTTSWTCYTVSLPAGAQGSSVRFRWEQVGGFISSGDNWALDNVEKTCEADFNYSWSPNGSLASPNDSDTKAAPDTSTIYTVTATKASDASCQVTDTVEVLVDSAKAIVAEPDTITCTNTSVTLDGSASYTTTGSIDYSWSNGANTATTSVSSAGSYTLTVTEPTYGCTDDTAVTVAIDTVSPDANVAPPDTLTCTTTSVTLDASASTSANGHTYSWSNGDSGPTTSITVAGSYQVTVTDTANGCTDDTIVAVPIDTVSPDPMVAEPDTLTCTNTSVTLDASATTSANGHSYSWSNGDTGPTTSVSNATSYTVTVTDDYNGCVADTTVTVPIDTVTPDPNVAEPDTLTCTNTSVTLDASATTSANGHSYSWSNGDTGPTTSVSNATSYTVTVTDDYNGCVDDTTVTVPIDTVTPDPNVAAPDTLTCTNTSVTIDASATTSANGHSYSWSNGDTGPTTTVGSSGSYTVTVTDDYNGCVDDTTVAVPVDSAQPTAIIGQPDTLTCTNTSVTLDASASTSANGHSYSWSNGDTGPTTSVGASGSYTVTVTDDYNGCVHDTSVAVPVDSTQPTAIIAQPDTLTCANTSVTLDGSGSMSKNGHTYSWSNGDTGPTTSVGASGSYTLTVTDTGNGCVHDTSVTVPVDSTQPTAIIAQSDTLTCTTTSVTLDASASTSKNGHTYSWSNGDTGPTTSVSSATSFTVTVTDTGNGCVHDTSATVPIDTVAPTASIANADTFTCTTDSVILDGSGSTSNSGSLSYSWNPITGTILWDGNTATPAVGSAGDYVLTVTDPVNGCTDKDTVNVPADQDLPTVNIAPVDTLTCSVNTVTVDASGSTTSSGSKDFSWSTTGNIVNAAADSSWIDVDVPDDYTVTVTDPNNGCQSSSTVTVPIDTISPDAVVAAPDTLTCTTTSVTLDASASTSNNGHSYSWSNGDTGPTTTVSTAANYTVTVTDSFNDCVDDTTVTVPIDTVSPDAVVAAPDTLTCTNTSVTLDASATTSKNGHSYSWSNGDTGPTTTVSTAGNYTVTVTDDHNGCVDDTTVTVPIDTVSPDPIVADPDTLTCTNTSVTVDASATTSANGHSYSWSNGDTGPTTTVSSAIDLTVTVTDDYNGCVADTTVKVHIDTASPEADVARPDTLTCTNTNVTVDGSASTSKNGHSYSWSNGDTGPTTTVSTAGNYTVTVTDTFNGCTDDTTVTVPIDTTSPDAIVAQPDTLTCTNTSVTLDGSASTSKSGSVNYSWSNGLTSASITVTSGGSYTLTVTDPNNGCTGDTTFTVPVDTASPDASIPLPDTLTCSNLSVTVDASGSTSNNGHTYSWSTPNGNITSGTSGPTVDVDVSGSYDLTLTDTVNGCTTDTTAVVHVDSIAPSVSIASPDTFTCTTDSVILDGSASTTNSGNKSYSWTSVTGTILWDANTATPAVGSSGDYELTVTDPANGCSSKDTVTVPADQNLPTVNVAPLDTITCVQNVVTIDASASTTSSGNKDFSWTTTGGNIVNAAADSSWVDVDVSADYTVTLTDPANGCTNSSTETVPLDTIAPDATVAAPDTLTCTKTSVTLDASATTSVDGHTFSWSTGDSGPTTMVSTAGNYTVTATDTSNGCTNDTTVTVPIDTTAPTANVAAPDTLTCSVDTVTLDASATTSKNGHSYSWSNGDSGVTTMVTSPGNYTVTVTDDFNGCTDDTTVMAPIDTVSPTPVVASPDTLTCSQPTVTLDASASTSNSGSKSYSWSNGDSGPTTSVSDSGAYSVTVTDPNSGCTADTTVQVHQAGFPSITVDSVVDASCNGGCDGGAYISVTGGSAPYSYSWNDPSGQTTQDATGLCAGDLVVTVTDNNGCEVKDTVTVGEPSPVQVTPVPDTTICIGGTATLSASGSGGTPGYTYHWDNGLGTGQVKTVSPSSATVYTVYAEDANGCSSAPKTVRVELHPELSVTASSDASICPGDSVQLSASGSGGIGSGYSYSWSNGMSGSSITVSPSSTTEYVVTLEDACETPAATDTVEVTIDPLPDVQIGGQDLKGCKPVNASLVNATPDSMVGGSCTWNFGDGTQASGCGSVSHLYEKPGCYDVTLSVTSPEGCVDSTTLTDYVCVRPYPTADFSYGPKSTTVMDPAIEFTNQSTGAYAYQWDFAGKDTSEAEHPSYQFPSEGPGNYKVCLDATSLYGCKDSVCKTVKIDGKFSLYVPNAFTPDGDGKNDKFYPVIRGADRSNYQFTIYDRWGEVVFQTNRVEDKWDGSIKGETSEAKTDVYVWRIETKNKYNGKEIVKQGHVTLIR